MPSGKREWLYPGREKIEYEWHQSLEYDAKKAREKRIKMVKKAAANCTLPLDAFADDVIDNDHAVYYPKQTIVETNMGHYECNE